MKARLQYLDSGPPPLVEGLIQLSFSSNVNQSVLSSSLDQLIRLQDALLNELDHFLLLSLSIL